MKTKLQIRIDEDLKQDAITLFEKMDIDLSTAIRIFLRKCVQTQSIPLNLDISDNDELVTNSMQRKSIRNGNNKYSLEEINEIISEVRKNKNRKEKK